jgi:hypothetical protein
MVCLRVEVVDASSLCHRPEHVGMQQCVLAEDPGHHTPHSCSRKFLSASVTNVIQHVYMHVHHVLNALEIFSSHATQILDGSCNDALKSGSKRQR